MLLSRGPERRAANPPLAESPLTGLHDNTIMSGHDAAPAASAPIHILVVNPNSTEAFTEVRYLFVLALTLAELHFQSMRDHLTAAAPPGVTLSFLTAPAPAPASINSVTTSVLSASAALPSVLSRIAAAQPHGILIACFSAHPLVPMLREQTSIPVVGIMHAAILFASQLGGRVGVLTTDARWGPLLTHEIRAEGLEHLCAAGVLSSGLAVLELETLPREEVLRALSTKARELVDQRGADVLVLGCAGMVGLDTAISTAVGPGVEVVDPVRCGMEMVCGLARMRCRTAKKGVFEAHP